MTAQVKTLACILSYRELASTPGTQCAAILQQSETARAEHGEAPHWNSRPLNFVSADESARLGRSLRTLA
jgi:hypothetical protein